MRLLSVFCCELVDDLADPELGARADAGGRIEPFDGRDDLIVRFAPR
jgi:hypothetical protein